MTNSRNKGLRFELQVASLIEDDLGIKSKSNFYSLKEYAGKRVDDNLVLIEKLFVYGLANIENYGAAHVLTPYSPLCHLIVKNNSEVFGLGRVLGTFHYDVNHSSAARVVNDIENFFRDRLKVFIFVQMVLMFEIMVKCQHIKLNYVFIITH